MYGTSYKACKVFSCETVVEKKQKVKSVEEGLILRMTNLQEILLSNCHRAATQNQINEYYTGYLTMGIITISSTPITVILNTVTIYIFLREKRTKTIADILFCFLTTTDIIRGLVAMPLFSLENILRAMKIKKPCLIFLVRKDVGFLSGDITLVTSLI